MAFALFDSWHTVAEIFCLALLDERPLGLPRLQIDIMRFHRPSTIPSSSRRILRVRYCQALSRPLQPLVQLGGHSAANPPIPCRLHAIAAGFRASPSRLII